MGPAGKSLNKIATASATVAILCGAHPSAAQRSVDQPVRVLTGVVVDELTRVPIADAVVVLEGHQPGTMTDSVGHFTLSGFPRGPQVLNIRQFGYLELTSTVLPPELPDVLVEIPLVPAPIMLERVTLVVDHLATMTRRIESRRRAAPVSVRAYDQERLVRSGAPDVFRFLLQQASIFPTLCGASRPGTFGLCVIRRGRPIKPSVFIDEFPALGGLDELSMYNPQDLYLIEVYSFGRVIRAYTYEFMERMAERPMALLPIREDQP